MALARLGESVVFDIPFPSSVSLLYILDILIYLARGMYCHPTARLSHALQVSSRRQNHLSGGEDQDSDGQHDRRDPCVHGAVRVQFEDDDEAGQASLALHDCHLAFRILVVYHVRVRVAPHSTVVQHYRVVVSGERAAAVPLAVD